MQNDPQPHSITHPAQTPAKPVARLSPQFPDDLPELLPPQMIDAVRWTVWRYELDEDGDWTKKPINPRTGRSGAKSNDPKTWGTFPQAAARFKSGGFDGLMFALGDGIMGVDLDHCIDTEAGTLGRVQSKLMHFESSVIVERFDTYTEVSPSGDGLHLWMRGTLPVGGRKSANVEMYGEARFFTVTGARLADAPAELAERTELLTAFHREVFFDEQAAAARVAKPTVAAGQGPVLSDEAIIEKAHRAKNAAKFLALWNGDRSAYKSGSESDLALIGILGFYTSDADQLDRLFRQSGLMREKWERDDYRARTIDRVLSKPRPMWTPASERDRDDPGPGGPGGKRAPGGATVASTGALPHIRKVYRFTEFGNAERLLDAHGADIRYNEALGFIAWDGRRWKVDAEIQVRAWASQVVRAIFGEAAEAATEAQKAAERGDDEGARAKGRYAESLLEWARKSSTEHMVKAMVTLIQPDAYASEDIFDARPMLFNCANGTIDLTTGELRAHSRDDYLTQCSPVEYDPAATAPTFLRFLGEIMLERDELVDYLQRAFGYSISGSVKEQVWHLLVGEGANGKTTLIETLEYVIGDYAATMEPESITIIGQRRDAAAPSPDIAALKGVRFTKITETEEGARIAPARVKRLSGGDKLSARYLHKDIFEFYPTHKLWLYTNHRPEARETTHAFWRRVRYIPFELNLREHPERQDPDLPAKLQAEAQGILAWLIAGCLRWQNEGLAAPALMTEATETYRADMDVLAAFIRDRCVVQPHCQARANALYDAYKAWCEDNGEHPRTQRKFGQALTEKGFGTRVNNGTWRIGLGLRNPNDSGPDDSWWQDDHSAEVDTITEPSEPSPLPTEPSQSQRFRASSPDSKPTSDASRGATEPLEPIFGEESRAYAPREKNPRKGSEGSVGSVGLAGGGYSATPPDKNESCPKGGRHMWSVALGGEGWACRKCRPELVNRPR